MKYLNVKYRSSSCQDSQKLQNDASNHYPATIFALCIYFLQYETPFFRIYAFRTRRLIHISWFQNLNLKLGALRQEKKRGLAFYTGTSCLVYDFSGLAVIRGWCLLNFHHFELHIFSKFIFNQQNKHWIFQSHNKTKQHRFQSQVRSIKYTTLYVNLTTIPNNIDSSLGLGLSNILHCTSISLQYRTT